MLFRVSLLFFTCTITNFVSSFHVDLDELKPPSLKVSGFENNNDNSLANDFSNIDKGYCDDDIEEPEELEECEEFEEPEEPEECEEIQNIEVPVNNSSFVCGCQPNDYTCGQDNIFKVSDFHISPVSPKRGDTILFYVTGIMSMNLTDSDFAMTRFSISNATKLSAFPAVYDRFDKLCNFLSDTTNTTCGDNSTITTGEFQETTILGHISVPNNLPNGVYDYSLLAFLTSSGRETNRNTSTISCLTTRITLEGDDYING